MYNRDPPLSIQKLIKVVDPYAGENTLGKRIEKSRVSLSIAAKVLEKMRESQKRHFQNRRSTHTFKVGDLVLQEKHNAEKMDLKWEPNYGIVTLPSAWSAVVEIQISGKSKRCIIGDLKLKHPSEDWEFKPSSIGRAAKFVNHPENLPNIDYSVDEPPAQPQVGTDTKHDNSVVKPPAQTQVGIDPKYNLRRFIKPTAKLDL